MSIVTRFAPSPNGLLHVGHAFSALFSERFARARGGRFLLRIEDIDTTRAREAFIAAIEEDLRWLGLEWERPVRRQSARMAAYRAALDALRGQGLLYPCFCSRRQVAEAAAAGGGEVVRDPDGAPLYPGTCRHMSAEERAERLAAGQSPAWRLDMAAALRRLSAPLFWREEGRGPGGESGRIAARPESWGDVILARRDIGVSYHVAVVVDDADQGVSHVTRGADLFHATAVHRLLQELLGLQQPAWVHHRLLTDAEGRKLSKSRGDASLRALREAGVSARRLRRELGF